MQTNNHIPPMQHFENLFQMCFVEKDFASTVDAHFNEISQMLRESIPCDPKMKNQLITNFTNHIKKSVLSGDPRGFQQIMNSAPSTVARQKIEAMAGDYFESIRTAIFLSKSPHSSTPPVTPAHRHTSSQREKATDMTPQFGSTVQQGTPNALPEKAKERLIEVTTTFRNVCFKNLIFGKHPEKMNNYAKYSVNAFVVDVIYKERHFNFGVEIHKYSLEYHKSNCLLRCSPDFIKLENTSRGTRLTISEHEAITTEKIHASGPDVKKMVDAKTKEGIRTLWVGFQNGSQSEYFRSEILCAPVSAFKSNPLRSFLKEGADQTNLKAFLGTLSCSVLSLPVIARPPVLTRPPVIARSPAAALIPAVNWVHQPDLKRKFDESDLGQSSSPAKRQMVNVAPPSPFTESESESEIEIDLNQPIAFEPEIEIDLNQEIPVPELDD